MYGLINKAIQDMVTDRAGEARWKAICARAGVRQEIFLSMQAYDDRITYRLVEAAAEELKVSAETVLEDFGEYWIEFTAEEGFGELLNAAGTNLPRFLANLDQMHARIRLTFPELKPPSFEVTDLGDSELKLHYHSDRQGLAPLVSGILRGLARRFDTPIRVSHGVAGEEDRTHDVFHVVYGATEPGHGAC